MRPLSPLIFERLMDVRLVVATRLGPSFILRLRDVNGPAEVFGTGEYLRGSQDSRQPRYVLDAGAHVGAFTVWAASRWPECKIVAIEPNPGVREFLEMNVRRNHLDDRVVVRPWALAAGPGLRWLHLDSDSAASGLTASAMKGDIEVETVGLTTAIASTGFPEIDLLKIDIEGAEYEVFDATHPADIRSVGQCVVECHLGEGRSSDEIAARLRIAGFDVTTVVKNPHLRLLVASQSVPTD